ncbi:hypothetical protein NQ317_010066 [Molorchus minor]|uniref:THAP9-like helix-turn-helix domain-containing protein n=1 Tax=Molorchus minor TaxID=1323400 RepID=A0ABQ9JLW0_9CUCU|nr:hypothetical protein NQ317_010066 [Molorchus minor]
MDRIVFNKYLFFYANLEPIPKALLTHSQTLKKKCHEFPLSLKVFASTMACLSPKAFAYLRKVFPCLPNPASLRRWDGNADVQQGVCDAVAEVLDDEDKKRKKRKIPSKVIVDNVSNEADAGDYDESNVYHDHADVDQDSGKALFEVLEKVMHSQHLSEQTTRSAPWIITKMFLLKIQNMLSENQLNISDKKNMGKT